MRTLYFCPVVSFYLSSIFFLIFFIPRQSQRPQIGCLPYFHTWCGLSANLRCRSEMCSTRLAGNAGRKKSPKIRRLGTIAQLCRDISSHGTYRQSEKLLTRMWANAQHDGRPAEYRWRPLFNPAKFGCRPLLDCCAVTLPRGETR